MKVAIFGTGYVGLVTGVCLADLGHTIFCVDVDSAKIDRLNLGEIPIYEPGLETLLHKNRTSITFTIDSELAIQEVEFIFIAVGTPQSDSGQADLQYVRSVAESIGNTLSKKKYERKIIVVKSTVPVGTGDMIDDIIRKKYSGEFAVVSNPEFLKEGSAIKDFKEADRIVIGSNNAEASDMMALLYEKLEAPIVRTDRRSSELIKYAANAFLATKISFINSIANLATEVGADVESIALGIGLDRRIGSHFLKAGIGYGGSCFPKDVSALIHSFRSQGISPDLLEAVEKINEEQKTKVVSELKKKLGNLTGKKVGVLGLSFKPGTDDLREAPSLVILSQLLDAGMSIKAWDPISEKSCAALFPDVFYCPSPYEAITDADAFVVVTEWDEVKRMDLSVVKKLMHGRVLIDGRNVFNPTEAKNLGFEYVGIGRG